MNLFDGIDIVGSSLVNEVVKPVGEEQVCMAAPEIQRLAGGIIAGEIVVRDINGQAAQGVAEILAGEGVGVVLGVTGDIKLTRVFVSDDVCARFVRSCQNV